MRKKREKQRIRSKIRSKVREFQECQTKKFGTKDKRKNTGCRAPTFNAAFPEDYAKNEGTTDFKGTGFRLYAGWGERIFIFGITRV